MFLCLEPAPSSMRNVLSITRKNDGHMLFIQVVSGFTYFEDDLMMLSRIDKLILPYLVNSATITYPNLN